MKAVDFPDWRQVLAKAKLPAKQRNSFQITIGWFLSFCRRGRGQVTHQAARDFIDWATREKRAETWQVEGWKEALRWFFREGQRRQTQSPDGPGARPESEPTVWLPPEKAAWPLWKVEFLKVLRRRHYSYRTEQSYLVWIQRFARHLRTDALSERTEEDLAAFLDTLSMDRRLSASSQRQALNALVFLYREVFGQELGDFSDFRRAKIRPHAREWLQREELTGFGRTWRTPGG